MLLGLTEIYDSGFTTVMIVVSESPLSTAVRLRAWSWATGDSSDRRISAWSLRCHGFAFSLVARYTPSPCSCDKAFLSREVCDPRRACSAARSGCRSRYRRLYSATFSGCSRRNLRPRSRCGSGFSLRGEMLSGAVHVEAISSSSARRTDSGCSRMSRSATGSKSNATRKQPAARGDH